MYIFSIYNVNIDALTHTITHTISVICVNKNVGQLNN